METLISWVVAFAIQVWKMRRHQDAWFRLHKQSDLYEAKRLERAVDGELSKRLVFENGKPTGLDLPDDERPTETPKQTTLFE